MIHRLLRSVFARPNPGSALENWIEHAESSVYAQPMADRHETIEQWIDQCPMRTWADAYRLPMLSARDQDAFVAHMRELQGFFPP